ncbi:HAD family hydrolase [Aquabacterium lacunae]|uniref:phosphoglycolate phosphatase n=1 Tax=Aquabacterium lacunae TaxID=2528630 RepID=A0A4Q9H1Z5_9BURK|nr:HAD-IA family hydrolase [Aquabacterium lacunae]TBO34213.1 HAD family hydrolase [Aquabacterium lacunae]
MSTPSEGAAGHPSGVTGQIEWPAPVQAVLFDLDGTLADTAGDLGGAVNVLRVREGLPPMALDLLRPHASAGARGLLGVGMNLFPGDERYEAMRLAFLDAYLLCLADTTALFPGMTEVLNTLETRGLAWGVVTNKPHRFTVPVMEGLGLMQRSGTTISGDTTAHAKPHPLPLLTAAEQLGVDPARTLYVGDDLRDIQAAQAAGMPSAAAAWGYLGTAHEVHSWGASVICQHPLDLLRVI